MSVYQFLVLQRVAAVTDPSAVEDVTYRISARAYRATKKAGLVVGTRPLTDYWL